MLYNLGWEKQQTQALFISTGCTRDTNIQSLQDKTIVPPMGTYFILLATHLKQMTQTQTHPSPKLNAHLDPQIN